MLKTMVAFPSNKRLDAKMLILLLMIKYTQSKEIPDEIKGGFQINYPIISDNEIGRRTMKLQPLMNI